MAAAGFVACLVLALRGVPVWRLSGAITVFSGVTYLCSRRKSSFLSAVAGLAEKKKVLERQAEAQSQQKEKHLAELQRREGSITEIAELYQLSKRFLATLDWEQARQITEESLAEWVPSLRKEDRARVMEKIRELVDKSQISVEALIQVMPLAGTDFLSRDHWAIVSGQLALGLQRIALYRQVQELATHDGLTGLLVRRTFRERLEEEVERSVRRSAPVTFLMVDLDRFKEVNDTYGHLVGDVVLREIAALIRGSVREMDLVGRYGGEEFGVLLPEAGVELGVQIAERIRRTIESTPIRAYDEEIQMTVSIGAALCPRDSSRVEELIEKADQAMYRAKGMGRNRTESAG